MSKVAVLKLLNDGLCYQLITQSSDLRWGDDALGEDYEDFYGRGVCSSGQG